ncbi:carboxymuconolactone decarboxylase family protein [Amycolatopsis sp. DSM 110486]|uniref:carboxymuconolactone decarboxylase family protein n=1 Tax=Amycolatopsis sp. DSM 110486 TaxID=2865832 RepID=UPI001C6A4DA5|nr:carboxymuconolactone decarboxylase family protein [Amycolatopsis sp. DSM 110486]QYN19326.1 carboxymuconolactone decarboxylase family protein [Amycolatopsis sp. DSM 110486]
MSTLPQIELEHATGQAAVLLTETKKNMGAIPNMAKTMASSPALLKGYLGLSGALAGGVLPAAVRERLALATAEYNQCTYCLSAHTMLGRKVAKLDADELERARHADSADEHVAALLTLSDTIARGRGTIDETVLKAAREAGVTNAEIGEVIGNLALNILTNYFNIVADTDNEFPVVQPHRHD